MPKGVYPRASAEQRFWAKVDKRGPYPAKGTLAFGMSRCWLFGSQARYETLSVDGRAMLAHRYSFTLHGGKLVAGMDLDHLCRNRNCVKPDHLEQVSRRENLRRSTNFVSSHTQATHCSRGHEFTPENTYVRPSSGRSGRNCKTCARDYTRDYMRRLRAAQLLANSTKP